MMCSSGVEDGIWKVDCHFGKIRPRARVRLEEYLLIGCRSAVEVQISGGVFGDNIGPQSQWVSCCTFRRDRALTVREIRDAVRVFGELGTAGSTPCDR